MTCGPAAFLLWFGALLWAPLPPVGDVSSKRPSTWPMFGGSHGRNMVNALDRNLPADWCIEAGKLKNVKWQADLGSHSFASPVVADGKVFVGTNNYQPRDPSMKNDRAVLMAFRESDGKFLWQNLHNINDDAGYRTAGQLGMLSTPAVSGRHLFYVTPDCEVICASTENGTIVWRYAMLKELKVVPFHCNICSPLVVDDLVFVVTGNGVDDDQKVVSPRAPSFIALHRTTGKLVWQSSLPGENIIEGQWSSPTYARVDGVAQVIFAGGDCVIYSFDPPTGKLLWKCDCLPSRQKRDTHQVDNYIVATPVVVGDRLYVGLGKHPEHHQPGKKGSYFLCLDIRKRGDVSLKSYDAAAAENRESALVWAFGGPIEPRPKKGRSVLFNTTMSTAAVHGGLVYITEETGYLHCLDAATGRRCWVHDLKSSIWGSPLWVDGRVFVCKQDGEVEIFAHGRELKLLRTIDMDDGFISSPVAANGVLYLATNRKLHAIGTR